jgi:hypothetical protein
VRRRLPEVGSPHKTSSITTRRVDPTETNSTVSSRQGSTSTYRSALPPRYSNSRGGPSVSTSNACMGCTPKPSSPGAMTPSTPSGSRLGPTTSTSTLRIVNTSTSAVSPPASSRTGRRTSIRKM